MSKATCVTFRISQLRFSIGISLSFSAFVSFHDGRLQSPSRVPAVNPFDSLPHQRHSNSRSLLVPLYVFLDTEDTATNFAIIHSPSRRFVPMTTSMDVAAYVSLPRTAAGDIFGLV